MGAVVRMGAGKGIESKETLKPSKEKRGKVFKKGNRQYEAMD